MSTTHNATAASPGSFLLMRPVWQVGVLVTIAGAIVAEAFALGARALGIPMDAGAPGVGPATPIPLGAFALSTLLAATGGTILAIILDRVAKRPAFIFVVTTVVLSVLSLIPPVLAADTAISTKVVLELSHLLAAVVVIPPLAIRLANRPPVGH
ncbi:MAG: DUF6069 family protein [Pseudonocardiaceae bacterium]